jgi:antitoxin ParD1/3/4
MQITLELSSDLEMRLRESVGQGDVEAVRRLLVELLTPTVEALLQGTPAEFTDAEFEAVADHLADELTVSLGPNFPSLSDYAVSRAGIYEDHP